MSNSTNSSAIAPGATTPHSKSTRRKIIRDGAVIVAITGLLFGGLELGVRLFAPQRLRTFIVSDGPLGLRDESLGHVNRPNAHVRVKTPEFESDYQISEQGFRDSAVYSAHPAEGVTRILVVGDSFAFGVGSRYEEAWATVLEKNLRDAGHRLEIIKAGVPGYDTRREVLYIEKLVDLYHPHKVVVTFLPNDLFTNTPLVTGGSADGRSSAAPNLPEDVAIRPGSDKKSRLESVTLFKRLLMSSDQFYIQLYLMTARADYFRWPATEVMNRQMEITRALLMRARQFCREKGIDLGVVSIPQQFQLIALANNVDQSAVDANYIDREFTKFGAVQEMKWFSLLEPLTEAYAKTKEDAYYRFDGHLNPRGNSIVASALTKPFENWLSAATDTD